MFPTSSPRDSTSCGPVIPELTSPGVALISSELVAAGQTTSFVIQFVAVTEGATTVVVACTGMNFTNTVTYLSESATCVGKMNEVTISLASGQAIQSSVATEISLQLVFNPKSTGPTVWSFTTFGDDSMHDQVTGHVRCEILGHRDVASIVDCAATFLLDPDTGEEEKLVCTKSTPWLQYVGNVVKMSVTSVDGGQLLAGQRLVIQPPSGYRFSSTVSAFVPLDGFP